MSESGVDECFHEVESFPHEMYLLVSQVVRHRFIRFLMLGCSAASMTLLLMYVLSDVCKWETPIGRNLANAIALGVSSIYSFVVYPTFVWGDQAGEFQASAFNQLLRYHGAAGVVNLARFLVVFPPLDWIGVHHVVNTLFGIAIGCIVNYFISMQFVFASTDRAVGEDACDELFVVPLCQGISTTTPLEQLA